MNIYVAGSWRNKEGVRHMVDVLRTARYGVFDFTRPGPGAALPNGFSWADIDPKWQEWRPGQYRDSFKNSTVESGLYQDFEAMKWADACVAVQPFGRSASLELGWFLGAQKPALLLLRAGEGEPELMFGLAKLCLDIQEVLETLRILENRFK